MSTFPKVPLADLIGVNFLDCGRDPVKGLDCWGVVMEVYRRAGIEIPDYGKSVPSAYASEDCDRVARAAIRASWQRVEKPEYGDVVAIHNEMTIPGVVNHFGVCVGDGKFVHALEKRKCHTARLNSIEWQHRIRGFYRWPR